MSKFFKSLIVMVLLPQVLLVSSKAGAQSYLSPGYILGEVRDALGFVAMPSPPGFVLQARPDASKLDYLPLKPPPRGFHLEANTPQKRLEAEASSIAELETARAKTQARAAAAARSKLSDPSQPVSQAAVESPKPMSWKPWDTE